MRTRITPNTDTFHSVLQTIKIKFWENMVPKLKACQTYLKICTLASLKVLNRNLALILKDFYLKFKFRQIGPKHTFSSDSLDNVYSLKLLNTNLTGFSFSQNLLLVCRYFKRNNKPLPLQPLAPEIIKKIIGFQWDQSFFS